MPTETAAIEPVSAFESPKRSSARRAAIQAPGDRRAACAAVGLEHIAVEPERPLAERLEVADRAERTADEPLDLDRPPVRTAARDTARCVRSPVDAGSIEYSAVIQPRPGPASQRGTPSSTVAVQRTIVFPCP